MTRTKKATMIAGAFLGMLMLTATTVTAAPPSWKYKHWHHRHHRSHRSVVVGGIFQSAPKKHYVPAHYVTEYKKVLVTPGHYAARTRRVLVAPAHFETKIVPAVTQTVTNFDGTMDVVIVQSAQAVQVWVADRYEMRMTKVWVPARYATRAVRRFVPGHWTY